MRCCRFLLFLCRMIRSQPRHWSHLVFWFTSFLFFLSPAERSVFAGYFRSVGLSWQVGVVLGRPAFCVTLFFDCVGLLCWIGYAYAFVCLPICNGTSWVPQRYDEFRCYFWVYAMITTLLLLIFASCTSVAEDDLCFLLWAAFPSFSLSVFMWNWTVRSVDRQTKTFSFNFLLRCIVIHCRFFSLHFSVFFGFFVCCVSLDPFFVEQHYDSCCYYDAFFKQKAMNKKNAALMWHLHSIASFPLFSFSSYFHSLFGLDGMDVGHDGYKPVTYSVLFLLLLWKQIFVSKQTMIVNIYGWAAWSCFFMCCLMCRRFYFCCCFIEDAMMKTHESLLFEIQMRYTLFSLEWATLIVDGFAFPVFFPFVV